MAKIYGVTLKKETESPFKPIIVVEEKEAKKGDLKPEDVNVVIDVDGIGSRIFELPVDAGNYQSLYSAKGQKLYYVKTTATSKAKTYYYDFNERKEKEVT